MTDSIIRLRHQLGCLLISSSLFAQSLFGQNVPAALQPPKDEVVLMHLVGKGKQIYVCQASVWKLKAPDAQLYTTTGELVGHHFAGPTWEHRDGSRVVGKAVANVPSADQNSIPWLLLDAVSHDGKGAFSKVQSIQRLNTKGGVAPARSCTENQEMAVPYQADYNLFVKPGDLR
jgi:hypothetical protein